MRNGPGAVLVGIVLVIVTTASPVLAGSPQVIKPVPDVDKPGVPGAVPATDLSCWQAAASNLLGGAGYGTGTTPQARADSIYQSLVTDLGNTKAGQVASAVNYWLYTYGKNPDSNEYQPLNTYTDVTAYNGLLGAGDYDFLLDELTRCQYVAVNFDQPSPHAMTLIGGNKESLNPGTSQSIWHDSDRDEGGTNDDTYANVFGPGPTRWDLSGYLTWANGYTTLCPGLNKPEEAVRNYDIAYYRQTSSMTPGLRVAGEKAIDYAAPVWETAHGWALLVGNEALADPWHKDVYLLVDYTDRDNTYFIETPGGTEVDPNKDIVLDLGTGEQLPPTTTTLSADHGQILYYWQLDHQPEWERIVFPNADYYNLTGDVKDWDLATYCDPVAIPGPGAPGDVNGDGNADTLDITPFIAALLAADEEAFLVLYHGGEYWAADTNFDGNMDALDITPFVALLTGGKLAIPEPVTLSLLVMGGGLALLRRRRGYGGQALMRGRG